MIVLSKMTASPPTNSTIAVTMALRGTAGAVIAVDD